MSKAGPRQVRVNITVKFEPSNKVTYDVKVNAFMYKFRYLKDEYVLNLQKT